MDKELKTVSIRIRVTPTEREAILAYQEKYGYKTISDVIRKLCYDALIDYNKDKSL